MKFEQLLEVLHDYTDINIFIEGTNTMTLFETSKPGLLEGSHQKYYDEHKDWTVVHAYPDHNASDGNYMAIRLEKPIPVHDCFFESVEGDDTHAYCMECGQRIRKW